MNTHTPKILAALALLFCVYLLVGCGRGDAPQAPVTAPPAAQAETPAEHARKHLDPLYRCPMHPQVTSDKPGNCPICGMTLVLVEPTEPDPADAAAPAGAAGAAVKLSAPAVQNLGVRTVEATAGALGREVEVPGTVRFDERGLVQVRVRSEGHVEALAVRAVGERVRRGQVLFEIHGPMLEAAQGEYAAALRLGDQALVEASAARLAALGLGRADIERVRKGGSPATRIAVRAPQDGVVAELMLREGAMITPDMTAMVIAATDRMWVVAEVPEALADAVHAGAAATLKFASLPGESFNARVGEVLPEFNEMSRTLRARLEIDNADGRLKAGMLARVRLDAPRGAEAVLVPVEAVIRTGKADRVIVSLGDGHFAPRAVVVGRDDGEQIAVLQGLAAGERVVVAGQFMLDSESQVRSSLERLGGEAP